MSSLRPHHRFHHLHSRHQHECDWRPLAEHTRSASHKFAQCPSGVARVHLALSRLALRQQGTQAWSVSLCFGMLLDHHRAGVLQVSLPDGSLRSQLEAMLLWHAPFEAGHPRTGSVLIVFPVSAPWRQLLVPPLHSAGQAVLDCHCDTPCVRGHHGKGHCAAQFVPLDAFCSCCTPQLLHVTRCVQVRACWHNCPITKEVSMWMHLMWQSGNMEKAS